MTPKEFDKELTRLSKLMAKYACAGNHKKCREIDVQAKSLFQNFQAHTLLKHCQELEAAQ